MQETDANTGTSVLCVTVQPGDNNAVRLCSSLSTMNSLEKGEDEILLCISDLSGGLRDYLVMF